MTQQQHRHGKRTNKNRGNNQLAAGLANAKAGGHIGGKSITRFPVYLKNRQTGAVEVVRDFNAVMAVASSGGQWDNIGVAPTDIARAVVEADAPVQLTVTRTYGLYRIVKIEGYELTLFPKGSLHVTKTWFDRFKPDVGHWVVRAGHLTDGSMDSYQSMNEKVFNAVHGQFVPATVNDFNSQYEYVLDMMKSREKEEREAAEAEYRKAKAELDAETAAELQQASSAEKQDTASDGVAEETKPEDAAKETVAPDVEVVIEETAPDNDQYAGDVAEDSPCRNG